MLVNKDYHYHIVTFYYNLPVCRF